MFYLRDILRFIMYNISSSLLMPVNLLTSKRELKTSNVLVDENPKPLDSTDICDSDNM